MSDLIDRQDAIDAAIEAVDAWDGGYSPAREEMISDALRELPSAQPERKAEKALRLLVEWAIECGFGYDNIPEEYEKYKDDIADMGYIDGLIYIAKMEEETE